MWLGCYLPREEERGGGGRSGEEGKGGSRGVTSTTPPRWPVTNLGKRQRGAISIWREQVLGPCAPTLLATLPIGRGPPPPGRPPACPGL